MQTAQIDLQSHSQFQPWFSAKHPAIALSSAQAVIEMVAEGATVPFMARYRKERTGNLDEVAIQQVIDAKEEWDNILKRQKFIVSEIDRQGKLTPELSKTLFSTFRLDALEDIYLPYKQKKKTKATLAKEAGLEPLADILWDLGHGAGELSAQATLESLAATFVNAEKGVADAAAVLAGVQDILVERLAESKNLRESVRKLLFERGFVRTKKGEKAKTPSKYENYFTYSEAVPSLMNPKNTHRYLALRRGWLEEELVATIGGGPEDTSFDAELEGLFENEACTAPQSLGAALLKKAARLALKAYVYPSIESEVHKALKDVADEAAITVFAENVKNLLLASPFGSKAVLGVDPGLRTGCKLAVVDETGAYKVNAVMHLQGAQEKEHARQLLTKVVAEAKIAAVAVGNGTAGRETESFVRETLKQAGLAQVPVVMVNEAGASVYSASEAAREEFPELDVTVRGAISIARRLQDPLAELVKIDPKSIGVGQYQHDVSQARLKKSLDLTVDTCVNRVGVNLNTASVHLLAHVSGIGSGLARAIVEHRAKSGLFRSREELLKVSRFSKKTFEQAAGFLRIPQSSHPLDNTGIHPERYPLLEALARHLGKEMHQLVGKDGVRLLKDSAREVQNFKHEVGDFTFADILAELEAPGRDPREEFVPFSFRDDIHEIKDLKPGMVCPGIVTNVANFGAFVDIGVHQDGLVHISHLSDQFVRDPHDVVKPGDRVTVRVLEVRTEKNQISLSMKSADRNERAESPREPQRARPFRDGPSGRPDQRPRRDQDRRSGPPPRGGPRPESRSGSRPPSGHEAPRARPRDNFVNNPFSQLAAFKDSFKKNG